MRNLLLILVMFGLTACGASKEAAPVMPMPVPYYEKHSEVQLLKRKLEKPDQTHDIVRQLFKASMAFAVPEQANIDDNIRAELLIDPLKTGEELEAQLSDKGRKFHDTVMVSHIIRATLVAPDFKVTSVTPEEQALSYSDSTQWKWILEPTAPGSYTVDLTITALVSVGDKSSLHTLKTYNKTLNVEITPKQEASQWLEKYWQWLFSTLLLPLAIWVYKSKKKAD